MRHGRQPEVKCCLCWPVFAPHQRLENSCFGISWLSISDVLASEWVKKKTLNFRLPSVPAPSVMQMRSVLAPVVQKLDSAIQLLNNWGLEWRIANACARGPWPVLITEHTTAQSTRLFLSCNSEGTQTHRDKGVDLEFNECEKLNALYNYVVGSLELTRSTLLTVLLKKR